MHLSVQGYQGAMYVNPADLTMLSPARIQVLEKQGRARIVAENGAKDEDWEAHMQQKYGESFDCRFERYRFPFLSHLPSPFSLLPSPFWLIPFKTITPWQQKRVINRAIVGRKDRGRYDRFMDSAWGKLQGSKRSGREN